jgi:hypothetical protein
MSIHLTRCHFIINPSPGELGLRMRMEQRETLSLQAENKQSIFLFEENYNKS